MLVKTQVLIIGGGIAGTSIARELSKYDCDAILVEKEADVGWGQTKLSYAIRHPGVRWPPESLAHQFISQSNRLFDRLIEELDIDFKNCGELVLAFNADELKCLHIMKRRGEEINLRGLEIINRHEIRQLEPWSSPDAIAALRMPSAGVFNPFDLTHAFYENAMTNGVHMHTDTEVFGITPEKDRFIVETNREEIETSFIVNAAGLYAQRVARMADAENFRIAYPTKTSCFILDRAVGDRVTSILTGFTDLSALHRFKAVIPTYAGNLLLYTPISEPSRGIDDHAVEEKSFRMTCESLSALAPGFDFEKHIIGSFSGVTARNDRGDFIIEPSKKHHTFIHAALPPPGITCSPAIGMKVADLLGKNGLTLKKKTNFVPYRKRIRSTRNAPAEQLDRLVQENKRYGRIVCRCEKVTEGEIDDAVGRGATTLDGVKFRTRAGMGTCQGNFCTAPIIELLAKKMLCPEDEITKKGKGSHMLTAKKGR
jgi:glycerol-3-phosphate dehydrogenase